MVALSEVSPHSLPFLGPLYEVQTKKGWLFHGGKVVCRPSGWLLQAKPNYTHWEPIRYKQILLLPRRFTWYLFNSVNTVLYLYNLPSPMWLGWLGSGHFAHRSPCKCHTWGSEAHCTLHRYRNCLPTWGREVKEEEIGIHFARTGHFDKDQRSAQVWDPTNWNMFNLLKAMAHN